MWVRYELDQDALLRGELSYPFGAQPEWDTYRPDTDELPITIQLGSSEIPLRCNRCELVYAYDPETKRRRLEIAGYTEDPVKLCMSIAASSSSFDVLDVLVTGG